MIFCDSHTHLYLKEFDSDRIETIERSICAGVENIFLPNVDSTTISSLLNLCNKFPDNCFPILGLHPCSVKEDYCDELNSIFSAENEKKAVAVGEIGIDLYWDKTHFEEQKNAFIFQIEKAISLNLSVVIHTRESFEETHSIINRYKGLKGVYHCFSGDLKQADLAIAQGFYLGIGGVVTYKNAAVLHEVAKNIPLEYLVLETDAPYLTPVPFRGQRNESAYIPYIAAKVAELKGISIEEVAATTTKNALNLFNIY